jgi:hypothetical protein
MRSWPKEYLMNKPHNITKIYNKWAKGREGKSIISELMRTRFDRTS